MPISAFTALQAVRDHGEVKSGQKVLIIGASGAVGTFAVQIAKKYGAEVTGVGSARNEELIRSVGADHFIDYSKREITDDGQKYDVILDTAGNRSLSMLRKALTKNGTLVIVGGTGGQMADGSWAKHPSDNVVAACKPTTPHVPCQKQQRRPWRSEGTYRIGRYQPDRRQNVQTQRSSSGSSECWRTVQSRKPGYKHEVVDPTQTGPVQANEACALCSWWRRGRVELPVQRGYRVDFYERSRRWLSRRRTRPVGVARAATS